VFFIAYIIFFFIHFFLGRIGLVVTNDMMFSTSAVSYLPMPVIGGYLAFIGYFCIEAGIGLAISQNILSIQDWLLVFQSPQTMLLAVPAFVAGFVLTYLTRNVKNDIALPLAMILIPGIFYMIIFTCNIGMDGARDGGWMGGNVIVACIVAYPVRRQVDVFSHVISISIIFPFLSSSLQR
jgi:hypothetical protein